MSYDLHHAAEKGIFLLGAPAAIFAYLLPLRVFKNVSYQPDGGEVLYCGYSKWQYLLYLVKLFYLFILSVIIWGYFIYALSLVVPNFTVISSDDNSNVLVAIAAGISGVFCIFFVITPTATWAFLGVVVLIIGVLNITMGAGLSPSTSAYVIIGVGIPIFLFYFAILYWPCAFLTGIIGVVRGLDRQWHWLFSSVVSAYCFAILIQDWSTWLVRSWVDLTYIYLFSSALVATIIRIIFDPVFQRCMPWLALVYEKIDDIPTRPTVFADRKTQAQRILDPFGDGI